MRIHRQIQPGVAELDFIEVEQAAGEFGLVEVQNDAFQAGNFMLMGGFGKNPDLGGDDPLQWYVA